MEGFSQRNQPGEELVPVKVGLRMYVFMNVCLCNICVGLLAAPLSKHILGHRRYGPLRQPLAVPLALRLAAAAGSRVHEAGDANAAHAADADADVDADRRPRPACANSLIKSKCFRTSLFL